MPASYGICCRFLRFCKLRAYDDARLAADLLAGAVRETFVRGQPPVRDAATFNRRLAERRDTLGENLAEMTRLVGAAFAAAAAVDDRMEAVGTPPETADSVRTQLAWLLYRGFPRTVPLARLRHYARYLKGAAVRVERARTNPSGDLSKERRLAPYWQLYADAATGASKVKFDPSSLAEIRWLIEEYRVSLFAQELRTAEPVSPPRLDAKFAAAVIDESARAVSFTAHPVSSVAPNGTAIPALGRRMPCSSCENAD